MADAVKIILGGEIGCGKSTVVRAAMKHLGWERPAGFFTHWDGQGRGADRLYFETWSGERRVLARRSAKSAECGDPPYEIDRGSFEQAAVASLAPAASGRPVVIDELGVIELAAPEFTAAIAELFRGSAPVLAVIQRRALERWLVVVGREHITQFIEVDSATRAGLPGRIVALFRAGWPAS
jgi:nucleoside-triphosphatase THEP1